MPNGVGGFGGSAFAQNAESENPVGVILTDSGDVLTPDGQLLHSEGGGRGQSGPGGRVVIENNPVMPNNDKNNYLLKIVFGYIGLKILGVF